MSLANIALVAPDPSYHSSWLEAAGEFGVTGEFLHGSGLAPDDLRDEDVVGPVFRVAGLRAPEAFAAYCTEMRRRLLPEVVRPLGLVPDSKLFIVEGSTYLGALSLRHELNDWLLEEGGHIGYSVRPSWRRRGVASRALSLALDRARILGIDRVLLTCDDDNEASAGTILKAGGQLEDVRHGKRRYWISLG